MSRKHGIFLTISDGLLIAEYTLGEEDFTFVLEDYTELTEIMEKCADDEGIDFGDVCVEYSPLLRSPAEHTSDEDVIELCEMFIPPKGEK